VRRGSTSPPHPPARAAAADRGCRPSPPPTTATSTAPTSSGPRPANGGSSRSSGSRPIITPGTHRTDKTRVKWGDGGRDDVGGGGAYTHMTLLSRTTEGMHNLFRMSSLASLEGHYFKPRMDRDLLSEVRRRAHRDHGLRRRRGPDAAARSGSMPRPRGRERSCGTSSARATSMPRSWTTASPIERQTQRELLRLAKELGCRCWRPTTCTTPRPRTPRRTRRCCVCSRRRRSWTRGGSSSMPRSSTCAVAAQMRELFRELPAGVRQHLAGRRAVRGLLRREGGAVHAPLPLPAGGGRDHLVHQGGRARAARATPAGCPTAVPHAG
jgi:hypothetical protein